jgi:hypothetical protein
MKSNKINEKEGLGQPETELIRVLTMKQHT